MPSSASTIQVRLCTPSTPAAALPKLSLKPWLPLPSVSTCEEHQPGGRKTWHSWGGETGLLHTQKEAGWTWALAGSRARAGLVPSLMAFAVQSPALRAIRAVGRLAAGYPEQRLAPGLAAVSIALGGGGNWLLAGFQGAWIWQWRGEAGRRRGLGMEGDSFQDLRKEGGVERIDTEQCL